MNIFGGFTALAREITGVSAMELKKVYKIGDF